MPQSSFLEPAIAPPPQAGRYRVLYLDPPWPEHGGGQIQRGADRHYPLMSVSAIVDSPFGLWAGADAHCYCWVTNNYLPAGFAALTAWGFRYVTICTWIKDKAGLGQYYRGKTEHCLFAVRGRLPYLIRDDGRRAQGETSIYEPELEVAQLPTPADLPDAFEAPRTKHSTKPQKMRDYVRLVSGGHGPMLECFARERFEDFDAWGNEVAV